MTDLTRDQLDTLRAKLTHAARTLEEQLDTGRSAAEVVTLDQTLVGRVSRVDAMQQQQMAQSTLAQAKNTLLRVRRALKALDQDDYGYCAGCDEAIPFARLQAQPETSLCLRCQDRVDRQQ